MTEYRLVDLPRINDARGNLSVCESSRHIPFDVKRVFFIFQVPLGEVRGQHAHKECHQFLICLRGGISVLADDGSSHNEYRLDRPSVGLYLPPMVWSIQHKYSPDALLTVLASHFYDNEDYIRDYDVFLKILSKR